MDKLSTVYEMETADGGKLKLTLAYRYLYQLRAKHRDQYEGVNRVLSKGAKDVFDNIEVLYAAYLCQLIAERGDTEGCMSFDEFLDVCPPFDGMATAVGMLVAPKKVTASAALS